MCNVCNTTTTTASLHLYELDIEHMRATDGAHRCMACQKPHTDPAHAKHQRNGDCKDRYGNGTPGCPACDLTAESRRHPDCKTSPYSGYCGSAWSDKPSCPCGRMQSTD